MEAQKDRLEAELLKLSQQLRDQKAQYQEDKSRAQAALHFHSQKEEVADQLQEERNSGQVPRATWCKKHLTNPLVYHFSPDFREYLPVLSCDLG